MDFSPLSQLGLSEKQCAVYLATLELGMAPVSVIARKAQLKRPTTHVILEQLCNEAMAEYFLRGRTRYYSVINPKEMLRRKEEGLRLFAEAIPQLMAIQNNLVHKPKVTFYEGKEDMRRLYLDVLTSKTPILNYFLPEKCYEFFGKEWLFEQYLNERIRKQIPIKVIMPTSPAAHALEKTASTQFRETRVVSSEQFKLNNEIYIYDDKMNLFAFDDQLALQIQSADVVNTQRAIFELAWLGAR